MPRSRHQGNDGVLDRPFLQVVKHLIAGRQPGTRDRGRLLEIVDVEIAHAPGANLAARAQLLERGQGLRERMSAAPMQQIAIEPVRLAAEREIFRTRRSCRAARRWRAELSRPGTPRRGGPRWRGRREFPPRPSRTSPPCRCDTCQDRGRVARHPPHRAAIVPSARCPGLRPPREDRRDRRRVGPCAWLVAHGSHGKLRDMRTAGSRPW